MSSRPNFRPQGLKRWCLADEGGFMNVAVLGSGIVGQVLGSGLVRHGQQVKMGTRNHQAEEVKKWLDKTPRASAVNFVDAAQFGEIIVLSILGRIADKVIE